MKLIPVVSVLAATASADLLSLVKTLEAQAANTTSNGPQFRNFDNIWDGLGGIFAGMTQQITTSGDYGCWCYFASNNGYVGSGFGQPVDNYDRACKALHDNYACMQVDDSTCDPYTVSYNVPANWIGSIPATTDFATSCQAENPADSCAANACIAESAFVKSYLAESSNIQNSAFQHSNINFDPTTSCNLGNSFATWSASRGDKACCGSYPNRQIFYNGNKQCCGGLYVFNSVTKQCCPDNVIRNIGDQC